MELRVESLGSVDMVMVCEVVVRVSSCRKIDSLIGQRCGKFGGKNWVRSVTRLYSLKVCVLALLDIAGSQNPDRSKESFELACEHSHQRHPAAVNRPCAMMQGRDIRVLPNFLTHSINGFTPYFERLSAYC